MKWVKLLERNRLELFRKKKRKRNFEVQMPALMKPLGWIVDLEYDKIIRYEYDIKK